MKLNQTFMFILILILLFWASPYMAFGAGEKQIPARSNELPWIEYFGIGARAIGMGGAAISIVDDGTALYWNPAGLARLRSSELTATLAHQSGKRTADFFGNNNEKKISQTLFNSFTLAYPFPTYRGSFVIAFGANRTMNFDDDILLAGFNTLPADSLYKGDRYEEESFWEDGSITDWAFGMAVDLSENTSLGGAFHYYNGDLNSEWLYKVIDENNHHTFNNAEQGAKRTSDISGYGFNIGTNFILSDYFTTGLTIVSPTKLNLDLKKTTQTTIYYPDGTDGPNIETAYYDEDVTLPYRFGFGLSAYPPNMVVGVDVWYTDWTQMKYGEESRTINDYEEDNFGYRPYKSTTDIRVGVEYLFPFYPARLRAGFASEPLAYAIDEVSSDRYSISFGGGILVDQVTSIDASFVRSTYERTETSQAPAKEKYLTEKKIDNKFLVSVGYRF